VQLAIATLTADEKTLLQQFSQFGPGSGFGRKSTGVIDFAAMAAIPRLLDKQLIVVAAIADDGQPVYHWTQLGYTVAHSALKTLPSVRWSQESAPAAGSSSPSDAKAAQPPPT
jgi:hypothetical protein